MTTIKIFKTPGCASCTKAIDLIKKVIKDYPKLKVKEINIVEHPDNAVKYGIMTSPTIVINEKVVFMGVPSEKALRKKFESLK